MKTKILHNPRCSKSRLTLELLNEKGEDFEIIEYLKNPPTKGELKDIIKMLGESVIGITRVKEDIFKELELETANDDELLDALVANPKLIERPIVIKNSKAAIGRPPENVLEIL